jgi:hypothetical protein
MLQVAKLLSEPLVDSLFRVRVVQVHCRIVRAILEQFGLEFALVRARFASQCSLFKGLQL